MTKIKRYIYIGDIHGSKYFCDFIDKYNDGYTFFYSLGDIFDRGKNSYEVIEKIKELYSQGLFNMVLGNHDLFYIFTYLDGVSFELQSIYKEQFLGNGGLETLESFNYNNLSDNDKLSLGKFFNNSDLSKESLENQDKYKKEIANFLFNNFNTILKDKLNNLLIHAGIPFYDNGSIIGENMYGKYVKGIDRIYDLDGLLKERNNYALELFTSLKDNIGLNIYNYMVDNGYMKNGNTVNKASGVHILHTWFLNRSYTTIPEVWKGLKEELDNHNINRLIVGHDGNNIRSDIFLDLDSEYNKTFSNRLLRIDRNFLKKDGHGGNFGYAIINNDNQIIEIGDSIELFNK